LLWTVEETLDQFYEMQRQWFPPAESLDPGQRALLAFSLFSFDAEACSDPDRHGRESRRFLALWTEVKLLFLSIMAEMNRHNLLGRDSEESIERRGQMRRLGETIYSGYMAVKFTMRAAHCHFEDDLASGDPDPDFFKFTSMWDDPSKRISPKGRLMMYLLRCGYELNYRKLGEHYYRRIMTEDGKFTYAWEEAESIKDFVFRMSSKEFNFDHWEECIEHHKSVVDLLTISADIEVPRLEVDRSTFSFRNGVYDGTRDVWYPLSRCGEQKVLVTMPNGQLREPAAAKYFDCEIDERWTGLPAERWEEIPTPVLDRIIYHQKWNIRKDENAEDGTGDGVIGGDPGVIFWFFVSVGRWMYDVGTDGWQYMAFHKGLGGTGKSTFLMQVLGNIYPSHMCGCISNQVEKGFGLQPLLHTLSWFAVDVDGNCCLARTDLQSMITGETVSVARKNLVAQVVPHWKSPGMMAGNELPGYKDKSGSISRRFLVFEWMVSVQDPDTQLEFSLAREVPLIIIKANRAYKVARDRYGKSGIWSKGVLPKYFIETQKNLKSTTNSLSAALNSDLFTLSPGDRSVYMPTTNLRQMYMAYCQEFNIRPETWKNEFFANTLLVHGLSVTARCRKPYPRNSTGGVVMNTTFVMGCDVRDRK